MRNFLKVAVFSSTMIFGKRDGIEERTLARSVEVSKAE